MDIFIDENLEPLIDCHSIPGLNIQFISYTDDLTIDGGVYTIAIYDKKQCDLYSDKKFRVEENFDVVAYYDRDKNNINDIVNLCSSLQEIIDKPGVLSYEQIYNLTQLGVLVYNGNKNNIKGASYDLAIDSTYFHSGVELKVDHEIKIEPFGYSIVAAKESVNLPRNVSGNYDLKVKMFCNGIILSNGPQVDPGYMGRLLCLLFNTSSVDYSLKPYDSETFTTIQFFGLSKKTHIYKGRHQRKKDIIHYVERFLPSRMSDRVTKIEALEANVEEVFARLNRADSELIGYKRSIEEKVSNKNLIAYGSLAVSMLLAFLAILYTFDIRRDYLAVFQLIDRDPSILKRDSAEANPQRMGHESSPPATSGQIKAIPNEAPEIEAPEIEAPEIEAPEIEAPEIEAPPAQN